MQEKKSIFSKSPYTYIFAIIAQLAWGFAYPLIKMGMTEWNIGADDIGGKMLFAGIRFFCAGLIVLMIAAIKKHDLRINGKEDLKRLLLFGFVNTTAHYYFFYNGLAHCEGSKTAIMKSVGPFLLVALGCILFHEKVSSKKIIGCILGFSGLIVVNLGATWGNGFTFRGEGMIILCELSSVTGSVLTRIIGKKRDPLTATGYSLVFGAGILLIAAVLTGGTIHAVTLMGLFILFCLIMISAVGFMLYNQLLVYNPIGKIAIFNALNPVLGTITSCLLLGEVFRIQYLIAIVFIVTGIVALNYER